MTNTIIEVSHTNYTERVVLNNTNKVEVMNYLTGKDWSTILQGDLIIDEMTNNIDTVNESIEMMIIEKVGDKFLPFYEGCERPQKLKGNGYLHIYGQRYYFNRYKA